MKFKKSSLIICLIICLFFMASVSATNVNDTAITATEDSLEINQPTNDVIGVEENIELDSSDTNEVLKADEQTFAQLNTTINGNTDNDIYLESDYKYSDGDDSFKEGIVIDRDVNIYGNGHTINGSNEACIFKINGGNVVFYNITFTKAHSNHLGGVIYGNCKAINCTFSENYARYGGTMYKGSAVNCTFFNNTADDFGGAIRNVDAVNCTFISNSVNGELASGGAMYDGSAVNCTFTNNSAAGGGGAMSWGSAVNCSFTNNSAAGGGGAMKGGSAVNCCFTNNTAFDNGGAMCWGSAVNCTFTSNQAGRDGGAMCWGSAVNCTFTSNQAGRDGGAMCWGSAVNCTFTSNQAGRNGGAMYSGYNAVCIGQDSDFYYTEELVLHWVADNFTTICGSGETLPIELMNQEDELIAFIDYDVVIYKNSVEFKTYHCLSNDDLSFDLAPGIYTAVLIVTYPGLSQTEPKNITLTITTDGTTFWDLNKTINGNTNKTITLDKNYTYNPAIDSAFIGGIDINRPVTINGNGHTIDAKGQARILFVQADNVNITNITFVNGKAYDGGAIYWDGANGAVSGSCFTENNAKYGGAILWDGDNGAVSGSCFTGNNATEDGGAICWIGANGAVSGSCFTGNNATDDDGVIVGGDVEADYCWFGGNATNYMDALPISGSVKCDNILFLNATANPNTVQVFNTSEIIFKLYCYNDYTGVSEYDNTLLLPVNLTITSTNGYVDNSIVNLGDFIRYTATTAGIGSVTASIENVVCTIELNINQINPNLSVENQVVTFGENATIALNYNLNATGKVNITLTGKKGTLTYQDIDLNATIMLPNDIPADEYNVTVSYSGDVNFFNATANATLTVNKTNSTLTINDNVTFDYNTNGSITVVFTNASSVVAEVIGQPNAIVEVNGTTITVSGLDAGNYTLKVTTLTDENHNNVTKTANITVNKAKTELAADAITATYNINKDLIITLKDSNGNPVSGVSLSVDLNGAKTYTTDKNGQIKVPTKGLTPKTYTAKITFAGNDNYLESNTTAKVTINKDKTKLTAKAVKTTYKVNKKLVIALKDSAGKALSGVKVSVKLKGTKTYNTDKKGQIKINVAKLVPKTYTAKITFAGNKNYKASSADVKVTVKKAKAKIKAKKKTYKAKKKVKKFKITLKDKKGKPIKKAKVRLIVKKIKKNSKKKTAKESKKNKKKNILKTNKKGKITFKINRHKKGKYMATVKFYGNKYYTKAIKKVKIKMK